MNAANCCNSLSKQFTYDVIVGILEGSYGQHTHQGDESGVEGNRGHARDELEVGGGEQTC